MRLLHSSSQRPRRHRGLRRLGLAAGVGLLAKGAGAVGIGTRRGRSALRVLGRRFPKGGKWIRFGLKKTVPVYTALRRLRNPLRTFRALRRFHHALPEL